MAASVESQLQDEANERDSRGGWNFCRRPWWHQVSIQHHRSTPAASPRHKPEKTAGRQLSPASVASAARAFLVRRRRLRFDPNDKLYFPCQPGRQVTSAVKIKNVSRFHVAFKFQTTSPKSCFMRPPSGILAPRESIVAVIVKFFESTELPTNMKTKDKFKIVSLKVKEGIEFTPELFQEHKDLVIVEQILRVYFLDPQRSTPELEKLKKRIAEAETAQEARKNPAEDKAPVHVFGDGNVLEEWNKMKLARLQAKEEAP